MEATETPTPVSPPHPIRLVLNDDLRRSRLTVFFRLILVIPHLVWLSLVSIGLILVALVNWFATLILGQSPDGLHRFLAWGLRYSTQVNAYLFLLANPFPSFTAAPYPVDLEVDPPAHQNRLKTAFRLILAIPALLLASVLIQVLEIIAFLAWFITLFTGRMPEGMENLGAFCLQYNQQMYGYLMLLTDRYPSLKFPKPTA